MPPSPHPSHTAKPLTRAAAFTLLRSDGDGRTLEGYAAVFNTWTEINSWEGRFKERIAPGAFTRTLTENRNRIRLQFEHGTHPLLGSLPIGRIEELREDGRGLFVRARLADNWLVQPVRDAIRDGAIDGMSFRFNIVDEQWNRDVDPHRRTILDVDLYELGPVVFPAYDGTSVGVRKHQPKEPAMRRTSRPNIRRDLERVERGIRAGQLADVRLSLAAAQTFTDRRRRSTGPLTRNRKAADLLMVKVVTAEAEESRRKRQRAAAVERERGRMRRLGASYSLDRPAPLPGPQRRK